VVAHRVTQVRAAIAWARQENLRLILAGAEDGWRMGDEIAKANAPVIVATPLELPERPDEAYDTNFSNAGALARAGVTVVFNDGYSGMDASNVRNLPHQAATAVAFGFPREKAVGAMTLEPARLLGVADRLGSL
jgi:imidazolonepropionase-like amidohydrolase